LSDPALGVNPDNADPLLVGVGPGRQQRHEGQVVDAERNIARRQRLPAEKSGQQHETGERADVHHHGAWRQTTFPLEKFDHRGRIGGAVADVVLHPG